MNRKIFLHPICDRAQENLGLRPMANQSNSRRPDHARGAPGDSAHPAAAAPTVAAAAARSVAALQNDGE